MLPVYSFDPKFIFEIPYFIISTIRVPLHVSFSLTIIRLAARYKALNSIINMHTRNGNSILVDFSFSSLFFFKRKLGWQKICDILEEMAKQIETWSNLKQKNGRKFEAHQFCWLHLVLFSNSLQNFLRFFSSYF